jgi:hypothetical protein
MSPVSVPVFLKLYRLSDNIAKMSACRPCTAPGFRETAPTIGIKLRKEDLDKKWKSIDHNRLVQDLILEEGTSDGDSSQGRHGISTVIWIGCG